MNFFIPKYQRGYRWTKQQVKDLLDDINESIEKKIGGFYCIQPLVIKKNIIYEEHYCNELKKLDPTDKNNLISKTEKIINEYSRWEVIDGQQRLTTIFILLVYLNKKEYEIEYETRPDSKKFLSKIEGIKKDDNIDYHHIYEAHSQISDWFSEKGRESNQFKNNYLKILLGNVKFIWYESIDEDPIKVFTRLNIGKIALTNSELIKALFLNKSNFKNADYQKIRLQQQEIAGEWDYIEFTLQNDEFWLFLNEINYDKPTRIDFIFDLICKNNMLNLNDEEQKEVGDDEYKTFRYFYAWFKKQKEVDISTSWGKVKELFQTFNEWFNDLELYHYVGFLSEQGSRISDMLGEWKKSKRKDDFIDYIKSEIKNKMSSFSDLDKEYDVNGKPKTQCRTLLLLHNIQTVINQSKALIENEKYKLPVFYKFPFHLFKKEKWDVEHVDSSTENSLGNKEQQKEWLKASSIGLENEDLKKKIIEFLNDDANSEKNENDIFEKLHEKIIARDNSSKLSETDKNKIWNFTLLDSSTNKSYGNSIFPAKRRAIIGKDQGKSILVDEYLQIEQKEGEVAFVPPCTKNVFLKYYNPSTNNLREWNQEDAEAYKENIKKVLNEFLPEKENNEKQ